MVRIEDSETLRQLSPRSLGDGFLVPEFAALEAEVVDVDFADFLFACREEEGEEAAGSGAGLVVDSGVEAEHVRDGKCSAHFCCRGRRFGLAVYRVESGGGIEIGRRWEGRSSPYSVLSHVVLGRIFVGHYSCLVPRRYIDNGEDKSDTIPLSECQSGEIDNEIVSTKGHTSFRESVRSALCLLWTADHVLEESMDETCASRVNRFHSKSSVFTNTCTVQCNYSQP